jgi:hypothetical protein
MWVIQLHPWSIVFGIGVGILLTLLLLAVLGTRLNRPKRP